MPEYYYEGLSREGERIKGKLFADDETELRINLRSQKVRPTKIKEIMQQEVKKINGNISEKGFNYQEKVFFTKELIVMLKAGLSITQCMEILVREGSTTNVRQIATSIKNMIENGYTFSQSLSRFPKHFDNMYLNLVATGEVRGSIENILEKYLDWYKQKTEIEKSTTKAIVYPLVIVTIILASIAVLFLGIAPVFIKIYRGYNINLPLSLVVVSTVINILKANMFFILTTVTATIATGLYFFSTRTGRIYFDKIILKTPFLSDLLKKMFTIKTLISLQLTLKLGLSLNRSLELTSEVINNYTYEDCLLKAREAVTKNEQSAPFLARSGLFPHMVVQIFSVGEILNSIPELIDELIPHLRDELDSYSKKLASIMEPTILTMGGIVIGAFMASFFLPLLALVNNLK